MSWPVRLCFVLLPIALRSTSLGRACDDFGGLAIYALGPAALALALGLGACGEQPAHPDDPTAIVDPNDWPANNGLSYILRRG